VTANTCSHGSREQTRRLHSGRCGPVPGLNGPDNPGDWREVPRTFRDGRAGTWYPADATLGWWGPDGFTRLVVATADPGTLPDKAT